MNAEHLKAYKSERIGGLLTFGSLELVSTLIAVNAIDDYYFCIQPIIAGNGSVRLFDKLKLDERRPLQYVASTSLRSGVQIIHYQSIQ
jgi:dihydrofolate reductase